MMAVKALLKSDEKRRWEITTHLVNHSHLFLGTFPEGGPENLVHFRGVLDPSGKCLEIKIKKFGLGGYGLGVKGACHLSWGRWDLATLLETLLNFGSNLIHSVLYTAEYWVSDLSWTLKRKRAFFWKTIRLGFQHGSLSENPFYDPVARKGLVCSVQFRTCWRWTYWKWARRLIVIFGCKWKHPIIFLFLTKVLVKSLVFYVCCWEFPPWLAFTQRNSLYWLKVYTFQ